MGVAVGTIIPERLLYGQAQHVVPWVEQRVPFVGGLAQTQATAIGVLRDGHLVGGVIYAGFFDHPEGGYLSVLAAFEPGARVTRNEWRFLFGYAFDQVRCRRISFQTSRRDAVGRRVAERFGFKHEATLREACGREAVISFGLLRRECRFVENHRE